MIDKQIFKIEGVKNILSWLVLLTFLQAVSILFQAFFLSKSIVILWHQSAFSSAVPYIFGFAISLLCRHFFSLIKEGSANSFSVTASEGLRDQLLGKYLSFGDQTIFKTGTGHAVSLLHAGIDNVQNYFQLIFIKIIDLSIIPWLLLIYMFFLRWQEALFLLLIFPVIIFFFVILGLAAQKRADNEYRNFTVLNNRFADTLRGMQTLKQLGLSRIFTKRIYETSERYRKSTMRSLTIAMTSTFSLDFFTTLSIAVIAVFLGFSLMEGKMSLFPALTLLVLAPEYFLPLRTFSEDYHATLDGKNAFTEVLSVINQKKTSEISALKVPAIDSETVLSVHNFSFQYPDGQQPAALKDINFLVRGFAKVAVVGLSGSGKTTLLSSLAGINSGRGEILIKRNKFLNFQNTSWQKQIIYIPQKPYIFHTSLRENIGFYQGNAPKEQVVKAAKAAGIYELGSGLFNGFDTMIGESEQSLSGGQAQRIALARAFLASDRHILLFDEPTAHLDIQTEYDLKQTMLPLLENHLVFFATHRLHWLKQMDYVLVMDNGHIIEQGRPRELLEDFDGKLNELRKELTDEK